MARDAGGLAVAEHRRHIRPQSYVFCLLACAVVLFCTHFAFLDLPYFWDELGQFVPAALDILHHGAWVPHSTVPNVHPPGVMAYLALVWRVFGYSIPATRAAMLVLASLLMLGTLLLAIELCRGLPGFPAFVAVILLAADPLFYTQSMMAQLDMPAALFTVWALLLFFQDRHLAAALSCTLLALAKETGILLPLIFAVVLMFDPARRKSAFHYAAPFVVLAAWLLILHRTTGQWFGDAGFAHYNIAYALHPVRAALSLARRIYYLFLDDFRWVGTAGIAIAFARRNVFSSRPWIITWLFIALHTLMVSLLGGAELERYLMPVLPLLYIAMAASWTALVPFWRNLSIGVATAGLIGGIFLNPPFPFPYENNLAMVDFVRLQQNAAAVLERCCAERRIYTAWPFTQALRDPAFGYVRQKLTPVETSDLHRSTLLRLDPNAVDVLVLYSRTWEPSWGVLQWTWVRDFLSRFYEYEPQMDSGEVQKDLGLVPVARWTERGQWIEIYRRETWKEATFNGKLD